MYQLQNSLCRDKYKHKEEEKYNYQFLQTRSFVGWERQMYNCTYMQRQSQRQSKPSTTNQPCRKDHAWAREDIWTCRHPLICNCSNHPFVKDHWETFKDKDAHTRDTKKDSFFVLYQKVQQFCRYFNRDWYKSICTFSKLSVLLWMQAQAHCSRDNITKILVSGSSGMKWHPKNQILRQPKRSGTQILKTKTSTKKLQRKTQMFRLAGKMGRRRWQANAQWSRC